MIPGFCDSDAHPTQMHAFTNFLFLRLLGAPAILMFVACMLSPPAHAQVPPAKFTTTISTSSQSVSVNFTLHSIRSSNFQVLVQQADGSYSTYSADVARTYLGTVSGYPGAVAICVRRANGTVLSKVSFEDGKTWASTGGVSSASGSSIIPAWPTTVVSDGGAGARVYAAEVGIDSTYDHYVTCGGTVDAVVEQCELSVMSANMVYLRDAAILHRIGKIIVRANSSQDPYMADAGSTGLLLPHMRTLWNTGIPMGSTHDIGLVAHPRANGGLAYVGVIGGSSRYSANGSDAAGDFSGVWRHEAGHNWSSSHFEGGGNPEGPTIMSGNSLSRFSSSELRKIISHRISRVASLDDLGSYALALPPRANQDTASMLRNSSVRIDVMANDSDSNGDAITLHSFDPVSSRGGTLTRSAGSGPDGRDVILYTPPARFYAGTDWFRYRIQDSSGMQAVGFAMIRPRAEVLSLADHWTLDDIAGATAVDGVRPGQNGAHQNGVLVNQDGMNPVTRRGAYYDGSDDRTSIPAPNYNTNAITFSVWFKRDGVQAPNAAMIFTRSGSSSAGLHFGASNELRYTWDGSGSSWDSGLVPPDNTWCLAVMAVSSAGTTLYLRTPAGLQQAANAATQSPEAFDGVMYMGWDSGSPARHFKGWLDDVRVYAATFAASDVESLYQQAVQPPSISLSSPLGGTSIPPVKVQFSATVETQAEIVDSVGFVESETLLGSSSEMPYSTQVSALNPGVHSVTARAVYGDWGYVVDSAPVTFTALAAPLPAVAVTASLPASKRGPVPGSFTITRDHPIGSISVSYSLSGTAVAGLDYAAVPDHVTLPDGVLSQTVTINPVASEPDGVSESLILSINSGGDYTLDAPSSATLIINDHITSIAAGEWDAAATWNSGASAPVSGSQNTGEEYAVAHLVTSNDPGSNSQALVAGSLRVKSGATLDLARLHAFTNQNVSYNLPATFVEDGGTIQFRCSTGSSTHAVGAALSFAGSTTLRINGGSYENKVNLTGPISGAGSVSVLSDSNAGSGSYLRQISVNSANNTFAGDWSVAHTGGGDEQAALRAGAARALGSGTVTVGLSSQLINDSPGGLDSLGGIVLNGAYSSLLLNEPWTHGSAVLSLGEGSPLVQLGNAASLIGSLSGFTGIIQGSGPSSSLTVTQTIDRTFTGNLGNNLAFIKSGSAALKLAGNLNAGLKLHLVQGGLSLRSPAAIASFTQSGGTCYLSLDSSGKPPLALSGGLAHTGGVIVVSPPPVPLTGVPYTVVSYQGTRSGMPPISIYPSADISIDYGATSNSSITVTFLKPGIALRGQQLDIANGDDSPTGADGTDFGQAGTAGGRVTHIFTITNPGTSTLALTTPARVEISGPHADEFILTSPPTASIAAGGSSPFAISFAPLGPGVRRASVTISTNVEPVGSFSFDVQGAGVEGAPGIVGFKSTAYVLRQGASEVDLTLVRKDGTLPVSFTLDTEDGVPSSIPPISAGTAGIDYVDLSEETAGGLFGANEDTATFKLSLIPRTGSAVPNKKFKVKLRSATMGAGLGPTTETSIIILAADDTKPTLTLAVPSAAKVSAVAPLTVIGTAGDAKGIDRVELALNGAAAVPAVLGLAKFATAVPFTLPISPVEGSNTLIVTAYDLLGNGTSVTRKFTFTRRYLLTLTRSDAAHGSLALAATPVGAASQMVPLTAAANPRASQVVPGTSVKLSAKAKAGFVFNQWLGLPVGAAPLGDVATITMPTADAGITAGFMPTPFMPPPGLSNTYRGLIRPTGATPSSNATEGLLTGSMTTSGGFTGRLFIAGQAQPVVAAFFGDGRAVFNTGAAKVAMLSFGGRSLMLRFDSGAIIADLVHGPDTSAGVATRPIYSSSVRAPGALLNSATKGFYTVSLTAPESGPLSGHGFATFILSSNGSVSLTGTLADGVAITASSAVLQGNSAPVLVQLATPGAAAVKGSSVSGLFILDTTQSDSDLTAHLRWFRAAAQGSMVRLYPAGWPDGVLLDSFGALYSGAVKLDATLGLDSPSASGNAGLVFKEGNLRDIISKTNLNISGNTIAKIPSTDKSFTLTSSSAAGMFHGVFAPDWTNPSAANPAFRGILIQKGIAKGGYGFFISNAKNDPAPKSGAAILGRPAK